MKDDNKLIDAIDDFIDEYGGKLVVWPKEYEKKLAEKGLLEKKNIKKKTMKEYSMTKKYTKK